MTRLSRMVAFLFCLFCIAYPIALIGVAFDVHPPFSMAWAGSALLILEGTMLAVALMDEYGPSGLLVTIIVAVLAYGVEALGMATGFPFGSYHYTGVLFPVLPGGVPLPVIFAWLMIMIMVRGLTVRPPFLMGGRWGVSWFFAAVFAMLLDLELEPVAFHLQHYWIWSAPAGINYYGVPLMNFVAWFVVAFILSFFVNSLLWGAVSYQNITSFWSRLPLNVPTWLYFANVLMFGLIDLTHGYYLAVGVALLALLLPLLIHPQLGSSGMSIAMAEEIGPDELALLEEMAVDAPPKKQARRTKKARKKKKR